MMKIIVREINGKYRLIDSETNEIARRRDKELDGGGHYNEQMAKAQAKSLNNKE